MTLIDSTISNNSGGIAGGGIINEDTLSVTGCAVAFNTSAYNGGGILDTGTLAETDSTIEHNSVSATSSNGGGIYCDGPSVIVTDRPSRSTPSTVKTAAAVESTMKIP